VCRRRPRRAASLQRGGDRVTSRTGPHRADRSR
jgi:hypothetical protein